MKMNIERYYSKNFHSFFLSLKIEDQPDCSDYDCLSPGYANRPYDEKCFRRGYCSKGKCNCNTIGRDGGFGYDGAQTFGKWCHCNPWNCLPKDSAGKVEYNL